MSKFTDCLAVVALICATSAITSVEANELIVRETDTGTICGYKDTPLLPATGDKYHVHDPDRPIPKVVTPSEAGGQGAPSSAPSDAIVLFDGQDLSKWKPSPWKVEDGYTEAGHGSLETEEAFGDFQLHLEWMAPTTPPARLMSRGNSGVLIMGQYEVQIFDSHHSLAWQIYPDGQAAALYGQSPPLVNACRPAGQWQSFDILFTAPVFEGEELVKPGTVTMCHNGVLVHLNQEIAGPMAHCRIAPYMAHAAKLPLVLQGHDSPVRFRNIWIRPLDD